MHLAKCTIKKEHMNERSIPQEENGCAAICSYNREHNIMYYEIQMFSWHSNNKQGELILALSHDCLLLCILKYFAQ